MVKRHPHLTHDVARQMLTWKEEFLREHGHQIGRRKRKAYLNDIRACRATLQKRPAVEHSWTTVPSFDFYCGCQDAIVPGRHPRGSAPKQPKVTKRRIGIRKRKSRYTNRSRR